MFLAPQAVKGRTMQAYGWVCPICHSTRRSEKPVGDHNHRTKKSRATLCSSCNLGLGLYADNPEWLRSAATYLERWSGP